MTPSEPEADAGNTTKEIAIEKTTIIDIILLANFKGSPPRRQNMGTLIAVLYGYAKEILTFLLIIVWLYIGIHKIKEIRK